MIRGVFTGGTSFTMFFSRLDRRQQAVENLLMRKLAWAHLAGPRKAVDGRRTACVDKGMAARGGPYHHQLDCC
jgi:hypothetical protein